MALRIGRCDIRLLVRPGYRIICRLDGRHNVGCGRRNGFQELVVVLVKRSKTWVFWIGAAEVMRVLK